jgi:hypothetical protein
MLFVGADPTYLSLMDIRSRFYSMFSFKISDAKKKLRSEYTDFFHILLQTKTSRTYFKLFIGY